MELNDFIDILILEKKTRQKEIDIRKKMYCGDIKLYMLLEWNLLNGEIIALEKKKGKKQ